jgi:hypothetical protein
VHRRKIKNCQYFHLQADLVLVQSPEIGPPPLGRPEVVRGQLGKLRNRRLIRRPLFVFVAKSIVDPWPALLEPPAAD